MVTIRDPLRKLWERDSGTTTRRLKSIIDTVANNNIIMTIVNFQEI